MKKYFASYWIRSAFYSFLQRFSLTLFGLANFVFLIRWLTPAQMGTWALFLTTTSIFEATKSGLLKNAHVKFASSSGDAHEKSEIASSSFVINTAISLIFVAAILGLADWLGKKLNTGPEFGSMLKWFIPGLLFMIFFSHLEAIAQSFLDFKGIFAGYLVRQASFFAIIIVQIFFHLNFSLKYLALYQSASILLGTLTLYYFNRKYLLHRFNASREWIKRIVGYGGYIFGSGVVANVYLNLDQLMAAKFISISSVAYYNASSRINNLVDIPSYAAAEILFPKSAQASVSEGKDRVKYLYERMVGILLSFTIPLAIFIIIFPHFVMTLIAGAKYTRAAFILQLYMITGLIRPMQNQAANILNSIGKAKLCFIINAVFLGINLLINYFCLSGFGFYGAAIGTLISNIIGFTIWYLVMRKQIHLQLPNVMIYVFKFYQSCYTNILKIIFPKKESIPPSDVNNVL